jgi:hypothetical protein
VLRALIACTLLASPALADDPGEHQHPPQDQALHERFYSTWMQPDNPSRSCCNKQDCAPVLAVRRRGERWEAQRRDGRWMVIPEQKIERKRDSPDGRSHLCSVEGSVFCFVAGEGT